MIRSKPLSLLGGRLGKKTQNQGGVLVGVCGRYNPELHNRTKHVARRHFFIRDMVEAFELNVPLVSTINNYADFFTKALPAKRFFAMRDKIMNVPRVPC